LCNEGDIKEKPTIGGKPTPPKMPKPVKMPTSPKTEVDKPKPNEPTTNSLKVEQSTPKTDVETQPKPENNEEKEEKSGLFVQFKIFQFPYFFYFKCLDSHMFIIQKVYPKKRHNSFEH
jgi:hypothetical protein